MIAPTENLRRRAYDQLKGSLISGTLAPGSRVSELKTAKDLGMSRGPVREAVSQLASEGLIDQVPGLGAFVKIPNPREMADLYDFRDAMESYSAAAAASRATPEQIARLVECQSVTETILRRMYDRRQRDLDDAAAAQWFQIDARFHGTILSAAGNPWIQRHASDVHFLRRIWCRRLDPDAFDVRAILTNSFKDHARILGAIKRHDADAARKWMSAHIQFTKRNYVEQVERFGTGGRVWTPAASDVSANPAKPRSKSKRAK